MGHQVVGNPSFHDTRYGKIKLGRLTLNLSWTEVLGGPVRMISREDNQNK